MTTSYTSIRIALASALVAGTFTPPASAAAMTVADASAALSFWIAWGLVYLGVGLALLAVAVAIGLRERRAWSSLLRWTADDEITLNGGETRGSSRRAA
jgi:hypothetical protein